MQLPVFFLNRRIENYPRSDIYEFLKYPSITLFSKDCVFTKNFSYTSLHVYWTGVLRVYQCDSCCKRWYFTFNGAECAAPLPIDGVVYMGKAKIQNIHRVNNIEGHCNNIHKGMVVVLVCQFFCYVILAELEDICPASYEVFKNCEIILRRKGTRWVVNMARTKTGTIFTKNVEITKN